MPALIPVTTPVKTPTIATAGELLVHRPPGVVLDNVVVAPTQTLGEPVMVSGTGFTVTTVVA